MGLLRCDNVRCTSRRAAGARWASTRTHSHAWRCASPTGTDGHIGSASPGPTERVPVDMGEVIINWLFDHNAKIRTGSAATLRPGQRGGGARLATERARPKSPLPRRTCQPRSPSRLRGWSAKAGRLSMVRATALTTADRPGRVLATGTRRQVRAPTPTSLKARASFHNSKLTMCACEPCRYVCARFHVSGVPYGFHC